jgi:UDP-2,3-diacylglucosamine hydrolase
MSPGKIYFLSDFHLGAPDYDSSRKREERIVHFLKMALKDATELYLLGDIFDFWFEYRSVVPKGYV